MRYRLIALLFCCTPVACHPINWSAVQGDGSNTPIDGELEAECLDTTAHSYQIIMDNCAACHGPNTGILGGGFDKITDLSKLVNKTGPRLLTLLKPGSPEMSFIYARMSLGDMPPPNAPKFPKKPDDLLVLKNLIMKCLEPNLLGKGWGSTAPEPDAGTGPAPEFCTNANTCADGGCCVFGICKKNGEVCGGTLQLGTIPGVCTNGSCVDGANSCGNLGEACCVPGGKCTAPKATCLAATTKCVACGGVGEECCTYGFACDDKEHMSCQGGGGGGRPGKCQMCGRPGEPCCGEGVTAAKRCDVGKCYRVPGVGVGTGDLCPADTATATTSSN